jgi:hypothetical protein
MLMVRLVPIILLLTLTATPAAGQDLGSAEAWRIRGTADPTPDRQPPAVNVGSFGSFGLGMFGLKPQSPRSRAVTVREMTEPRQRRAGVGFSLRF